MKLSQKAEYALRAMFFLAQETSNGRAVTSTEIAKGEKIPEKFLEAILVELRKAGLIQSQRGPVGGHRLARTPSQISVGEIWRAIDGPLNPSLEPGGRGERERLSSICFHSVWQEVEEAVSGVVDRTTLADLCRRAEVHRTVVDFNI